jgi:hypothetical protein
MDIFGMIALNRHSCYQRCQGAIRRLWGLTRGRQRDGPGNVVAMTVVHGCSLLLRSTGMPGSRHKIVVVERFKSEAEFEAAASRDLGASDTGLPLSVLYPSDLGLCNPLYQLSLRRTRLESSRQQQCASRCRRRFRHVLVLTDQLSESCPWPWAGLDQVGNSPQLAGRSLEPLVHVMPCGHSKRR